MPHHSGNKLIDPKLIFDKVRLRAGMSAADIGCGRTGNFAFPAAAIVGVHGVVYAVDILKDVLQTIMKRAAAEGFLNVHTIWADVERVGSTAIPADSLDAAWIVNAMVFMKDRGTIVREVMRLLKPGGRFAAIDWAKEGLAFCPPKEWFVDFRELGAAAKKHGAVVEQEFPVGKYHRGIVIYRHP